MSTFHEEFAQAADVRYLNHAAVGPWPKRTAMAIQNFAEENVLRGAQHYLDWMKVEQRLRERLARLLNAPSTDDIALVKNTSEALSFVAFGLDWRPGDSVVISDEEFPSNRVVWEALKPQGVEVIQVSLKGLDPEAALLDACGPRTRLLSISSVQFATGTRLDIERLGAGCKRRNVLFCIDAIQHIGALPFDVQASQCDFAMADGHKWMCSPEGLGVFYCRADLRPRLTLHEFGWHMLEHSGDYGRNEWQPAASAQRFECGSPNTLGAVALDASLSLLEEVGMDTVGNAVLERVMWLEEGLGKINGVQLHTSQEAARRSGILTFSLDSQPAAQVWQELMHNQVVCLPRGPGIRFSPHFYTPSRVIEETLAIVQAIAKH
ncbi:MULTISPECIES: aminotransferase class V-fold PLP-dependent enzyme [unclassified Pseudomonas]|uniref:aminotransferase class V-fold PLP-dependent enzyme n=1 Tax=unclassified Pseudomonas TaxID=196821 RepID=UPI000D34C2D5|nr:MULTISPECIES: aminotransferase class V-fold PLP-dependent enzyme [unclassified Pseudomonas]RAU47374.1 aminotransferase class V-fold PLP-dependent enzyme [Pseudomonas sp. RIT 409]RAU51951.1 aminotransferase class V-fold PLP-dependent enzyme [Pseudomonas sp. RIT 412]